MQVEQLLQDCFGIEDDGKSIKLYVAGPNTERPARTGQGIRTSLFHLLDGEEAVAVREYLATHPKWQVLKVNPAASGEVLKQPQQKRRRKRR